MCSHGDDAGALMTSAFLLADLGGSLETIHDGHLHVHEDDIELLALQCFDSLATIIGNHDNVPLLFQQRDSKPLVYYIVFSE